TTVPEPGTTSLLGTGLLLLLGGSVRRKMARL
ncbi:MAG: PEP-CTERM sorting domain-containing protein, partial [Terriglobales bacterium]